MYMVYNYMLLPHEFFLRTILGDKRSINAYTVHRSEMLRKYCRRGIRPSERQTLHSTPLKLLRLQNNMMELRRSGLLSPELVMAIIYIFLVIGINTVD